MSEQRTAIRVLFLPDPLRATGNPYLAMLIDQLAAEGVQAERLSLRAVLTGRGDLVHLHWPESSLSIQDRRRAARRVGRLLVTLSVARVRRMPVLWTVHNLRGHERLHPQLESVFWALFPRLVTGWFSLTSAGRGDVTARWPALARTPSWVTRHGHYRSVYPPPPSREEGRRRCGIDPSPTLLVHVGHIREYKNAPALIDAFRASDPGSQLLVAGACHPPALEARLRERAAADLRVHLRLGRAGDDDLVAILAAADLVVLPYRETFNSGTALLALSMERPVLLPRTAAYEELRQHVGGSWVHLYDGEISAAILDQTVRAVRAAPPSGTALGPDYDWSGIARATAAGYREALRRDEP